MPGKFEVDIDREKVCYDGEWLGREQLADKIKRMIDSQDFRVGGAGQALEHLQNSIANAKQYAVKLAADDARLLEQVAKAAGIAAPTLVRQAVQAYLVAQPRSVPTTDPMFTAITTEAVAPGDESQAVELTRSKAHETSTVLVDPSLQMPTAPAPPQKNQPIEDIWFKKV